MSDLWPRVPLDQLVTKIGSGATPKGGNSAYKSVGIAFIRSMNVIFFGFKRDGLVYLDDAQADALRNVEVKANDVLLNITGASIGRVTLAPKDMEGARVNQHVCIIRPNGALDPRYVNAYLSSSEMQQRIWADNYGVTRQALTKQQISSFEIPLAPLPEQIRIADKLDSVLARVDACRDRLDRLPALLKRFRQSILAAANSGRLTADWRRERGQGAEVEYAQAKLSSVATSRLGKMLDKAKNTGSLTPYLRNVNVRWHTFDLGDIQEMRVESSELGELFVQNGDLLVCEGGEPGRCAIWQSGNDRFVFQKALHRVRPDPTKLDPAWLAHSLKFAADNKTLDDLFTGTTIRHLTGVALANFTFALPAIDEQHEIVRRVKTLFAFADRLEARYTAARQRVEQLTPALLAKAFRGELVPQDPDDEPASELLNRLAASRAAAPQAKRGRAAS